MKIIEAMKKVKANRQRISDLQEMIAKNSAHLSNETSPYDNPTKQVAAWVQEAQDLSQESVSLLTRISATNLKTEVSIMLGGKSVTKTIAEWVHRRREWADIDYATFRSLSDRNLKEGSFTSSTGLEQQITIVRNYDASLRDATMAMYRSEPHEIDSALEVVNAVTDLV